MKHVISLAFVLFLFGCSDSTLMEPASQDKAGGSIPGIEPSECDSLPVFYTHPTGVKDFALVFTGSEYHIFHITHDGGIATKFGHATSTDLLSWTYQPSIDFPWDDNWATSRMWAPNIVKHNGLYYMFYAGVEDDDNAIFSADNIQRLGLAISSNLYNWYPYDGSHGMLMEGPYEEWCDYGSTNPYANDCRDPYVFSDDPGHFLLYATIRMPHHELNQKGPQAIAYAESDNLVDWEWVGYLDSTIADTEGSAESPTIVTDPGVMHYLLWNWGPGPFAPFPNLAKSPVQYPEGPFSLCSPAGIARVEGGAGHVFAFEVLVNTAVPVIAGVNYDIYNNTSVYFYRLSVKHGAVAPVSLQPLTLCDLVELDCGQ